MVAVDPAGASLAVARAKPNAQRVQWVQGDVAALPPLQVELATMTGNVAQVFVTDADWESTLRHTHGSLRPGGRLAFETRNPEKHGWLEWNRKDSFTRADIAGFGRVQSWVELTDVSGALVSFRSTFVFESDGCVLTSDSTLRFRHRDEVADTLTAAGLVVDEVRDAPDRPGREFVFIASRQD